MGKNGYLQKQRETVSAYRQAEKETYIQFMIDMIMVTLNDPDVMGKDVFGKKRITEVVLAVSKNFDKYHGALEKGPEADYYQDKLDDALGAFLGDSLQPFETRYGWIKKQKY